MIYEQLSILFWRIWVVRKCYVDEVKLAITQIAKGPHINHKLVIDGGTGGPRPPTFLAGGPGPPTFL